MEEHQLGSDSDLSDEDYVPEAEEEESGGEAEKNIPLCHTDAPRSLILYLSCKSFFTHTEDFAVGLQS